MTQEAKPRRIQRKREKGWRMPEGAVYVGRPTRWGNPFTVADAMEYGFAHDEETARRLCVECFRDLLLKGRDSEWWALNVSEQQSWMEEHIADLRGHDLVCWCPLEDEYGERSACHADVLLLLANPVFAAREQA